TCWGVARCKRESNAANSLGGSSRIVRLLAKSAGPSKVEAQGGKNNGGECSREGAKMRRNAGQSQIDYSTNCFDGLRSNPRYHQFLIGRNQPHLNLRSIGGYQPRLCYRLSAIRFRAAIIALFINL